MVTPEIAPHHGGAAAALRAADADREPVPPLREWLPAGDQEGAYAVQAYNEALRVAAGDRVVGRKIGLTSDVVQRQLGVSTPDYGSIYADSCFGDREPVPLGRFIAPRVEAEIAFVLGADLTQDDPTYADIVRATDFVLPVMEIVDSRIVDWRISIADTIADNASYGGFVLGGRPTSLRDIDLPDVAMTMRQGDEVVSTGAGVACLGNPIVAVQWLARALRRESVSLRAGDIVLSGALGPMVPVTSPSTFTARFRDLGSVSAVFEGEKA